MYQVTDFIDITRSASSYADFRSGDGSLMTQIKVFDHEGFHNDDVWLQSLMGDCVVIDFSKRSSQQLLAADVKDAVTQVFERAKAEHAAYGGELNIQKRILFKTKKDENDGDPGKHFDEECIRILQELEVELVGSDTAAFGSDAPASQAQSSLTKMQVLINLNLRFVKHHEYGYLLISPLNTVKSQEFLPARAIILKR